MKLLFGDDFDVDEVINEWLAYSCYLKSLWGSKEMRLGSND